MIKMFHRLRNANDRTFIHVKYIYLVVCFAVVFLLLYMCSFDSWREEEALNNALDSSCSSCFNFVAKTDGERSVNKKKTIYIWNTFFGDPTFEFGLGDEPFRKHNCKVQDCFIVYEENRKSRIENYDAVVFHGPEFFPRHSQDFPAKRAPFQRYVFFSMESPLTRPVPKNLDSFFNWTMTYRLDSEVLVIYFAFFDVQSNQMVSNTNAPKWKKKTISKESLLERKATFKTKSRPLAWFVSNCKSNNRRQSIASDLEKFIDVDIYGSCGKLTCPRDNEGACNKILKSDYYFYLSFENSNCEDYITEKLATAFKNDVVPIYYGGANLSKFLPPHSYIDARGMSAKDLADKIKYLINHPSEYLEYFWWKDFYRINTREVANYRPFCKLCEMLHDTNFSLKSYDNFYQWWNTYDGYPVCDLKA